MSTEIKCPIYHYALDYKGTYMDEDFIYRSNVYFNHLSEVRGVDFGWNRERHLAFFESREEYFHCVIRIWEGEEIEGSGTTITHTINPGYTDGLFGMGKYQDFLEGGEESYDWAINGDFKSYIKVANLFFEPLAGEKYPIWIIVEEHTMNSFDGQPEEELGQYVILWKEITFTQDEIYSYYIGGKTMRFASKELSLPRNESQFKNVEEFLATFVKLGEVITNDNSKGDNTENEDSNEDTNDSNNKENNLAENSAYLKFKEDNVDFYLPLLKDQLYTGASIISVPPSNDVISIRK